MPTEGLSEEALAFDLPTYGADLKRALDAAGLSYREAERVIGVDHNTLQRVASGTRPPNVEHYLRIERWLAARAEGPAPPGGGVLGARERLGRLMTKAVVAGGHPADDEDQSNDAHLGREFIRSRADLRLILAELDRRSPPTREGGSVEQAMDAFMSKLPGYLFDEGKLREAIRAALAAAPAGGVPEEAIALLRWFKDRRSLVDDYRKRIEAVLAKLDGGEPKE